MLILIRLFGVVIVVMGIIYILRPKTLKQYVAFWKQGKRLYMGGIVSLLFGILFLLASAQCRLTGVIVTLGVISLLKGIIIIICGSKRTKSVLGWYGKRSPVAIRFIGLLAIALGVLLLYSI